MSTVRSFGDCISDQEKKNRLSTVLISLLVWGFLALLLLGGILSGNPAILVYPAIIALSWFVSVLTSEYQSRMIRAVGARVTPAQFPELHQAYNEVRRQFGVTEDIPIVILEAPSANALALRFARKKMIVLFSEMASAVKDSPAQMRFILAHEMCHCVLDHGSRRFLELYKPAKFKRGRELTCDNAGLAAAGEVLEASAALAKLTVGKDLWGKLDVRTMRQEAQEIMSGFSGWLVGQYLTHPPCGERIANLEYFARAHRIQAEAAMPVASAGE